MKSIITPALLKSSLRNYKFILSLTLTVFLFTSSVNAEIKNDEAHQDAKLAIKKFESDFKNIGMAGIATQTIPSCYSSAGLDYRKIRSCGMLDIWAYSVDISYRKIMLEKKNMKISSTSGISFEEMAERIAKAISRLSNEEIKQKYGDDILKRWMKILNDTYPVDGE